MKALSVLDTKASSASAGVVEIGIDLALPLAACAGFEGAQVALFNCMPLTNSSPRLMNGAGNSQTCQIDPKPSDASSTSLSARRNAKALQAAQ
jgi:hypothetical protein